MRSTYLWVYTFYPQKRKKTQKPLSIEIYLTDRLKTTIDRWEWMSESLPFAYLPLNTSTVKRSISTKTVRQALLPFHCQWPKQ